MTTNQASSRVGLTMLNVLGLVSVVSVIGLAWGLSDFWPRDDQVLRVISGLLVTFILGLSVSLGLVATLEKLKLLTRAAIRPALLTCLAYMALVACVWCFAGTMFQRATVYVDNFSPKHLLVELDGKPWLDMESGETQRVRLWRGEFEVTVRDSEKNAKLDRRTISVDGNGPFVLNCLGAQKYERGMKIYTAFDIPSEPPMETSDVWIRANVDCLFVNPPTHIEARKVTAAASRTYLLRK